MSEIEEGASFLLVDDDATFLATLAKRLTERKYSVRTAADVDAAIAIIDADPPELAVIDLRLSDLAPTGGLGLIERLHAADPLTRIVMLTGYGSVATAVRAMQVGAVSYLQKPTTVAAILEALAGKPVGEVTAEVPTLARLEWEHIQRVMHDCGGNVSEAARRLGMHRRSLQRKLGRPIPSL